MNKIVLLSVAFALTVTGIAVAQDAAQGEYLVLAATRTSTMAEELDEAARRNYREISAAGGSDFTEVVVVLVPDSDRYEYRLLSTIRTSTLQRELDAAAADGYRVVPRAVTTKTAASLFTDNDFELLVIMEKAPAEGPTLRYQVLATSRTGTLQNELTQAQGEGWTLVTLVVRGEVIAILEKVRD